MKILPVLLIPTMIALPVAAQNARQLDAHEHGVGQLDIAFDGKQIAMELHAPGADIVGFEYAAKSAQDRAAVDAAVATLAGPMGLFILPASAGCTVVQASAALESEDAHEDHDTENHAHADDDHEEHDHGTEHAHAEEGHDDHADGGEGHTEFHAEYLLTCEDPAAVSEINFTYFDAFPNALELEIQILSDSGANAFEVLRDQPILDLRGMF